MNTKLLIVAALIAAAFAVYVLSRPEQAVAPIDGTPSGSTQQVNTPETPPLPYIETVTYNGSSFVPSNITIIEGGSVRFVNTSTSKMWVASDDHPTHAGYPIKSEYDCLGSSFDQCEATVKDTAWTYTFSRTGTWAYHNHENPEHVGSVTVMTEEEYLKTR
jgi:plastocyanin